MVSSTLVALSLVLSQASPLAALQPVGETRLKVLWFEVYNARLYSHNGDYNGIQAPLALELEYLRDIDADDLVEKTREEWQRLGLYRADQSEPWLNRLSTLWPDVEKGDRLTLKLEPDHSAFYFNDQPLGRVDGGGFGLSFVAIWLHPEARYPKLRSQLIGD
ncbi:chalcone isomerase family protein [Ferrimonas marina]|uniref:Chalcone isomerase-like n=1 Tax=Ferrimonas marina TaxID=299255 RepID=A0A1M5VQZ8_9GAMM|nr:chalcone isomerase family protein [Ferrimonas marina]SHH77675.1 Chalcone isomerase-like [Ferrimonas marina]